MTVLTPVSVQIDGDPVQAVIVMRRLARLSEMLGDQVAIEPVDGRLGLLIYPRARAPGDR